MLGGNSSTDLEDLLIEDDWEMIPKDDEIVMGSIWESLTTDF